MSLSICLVGNCQTHSLAFVLEHRLPEARIEVHDLSLPEFRLPENRAALVPTLAAADMVWIQRGIYPAEDLRALKALWPDKVVIFANLYFRGLHPDVCFLDPPDTRRREPSFYHSLIVLDAFRRGWAEKKAVAALGGEGFERLRLWDAWETSLTELARRDADVDVPAADLVDSYARRCLAFLNLNHPAAGLVYDYASRLLAFAGLRGQAFHLAAFRDPLEEHDVLPIHDAVAGYYGLEYRTTQLWRLHYPGPRWLDRKAWVAACYAAYRVRPREALHIHAPADLAERSGAA